MLNGMPLVYRKTVLPTVEKREGETYVAALDAYVSGRCLSQYGVEWIRFGQSTPVPETLQKVGHVGFEVADLDEAMADRKLLFGPIEPEPGVTSVYIEFDGCPIELSALDLTANKDSPLVASHRYHSIWQPRNAPHAKDVHLEALKMYAAQYENEFGVGWVRYCDDAPYPDVVKMHAHVVFEVDDIKKAIAGKSVIIEANSPSPGLWVAFIEENGAPIEFIQRR